MLQRNVFGLSKALHLFQSLLASSPGSDVAHQIQIQIQIRFFVVDAKSGSA